MKTTELDPVLADVLDAADRGNIRLRDGVARLAALDVTDEVNDLCGLGLLYNDGGRLVVLTAGQQWLTQVTR